MRGLAVAFTLLAALTASAAEPVNVQAARRAFNDAYRHGDWRHAVEIGLDLVQLVPRPVEQYNLACVFALAGDANSALYWLDRSAANGFFHLSHLDGDHDLETIRDVSGYARVRDHVAMNLQRHLAKKLQEAASTPPLTVVPTGDASDGPRPLIIALHGYGDRATSYPPLWGPVAEEIGAILAVPNGAQRVGDGHGWGDVEQADAIVLLTIEYVRERFEVDWDRVVLTGFSQGGFMAMAVATRHPDLFTGVIPMAGGYIPGIDAPPTADDGDPRFYFMVGSNDRSVKEVRRAASDFDAAGYEVDLRVLAGTGHSFPRATKRELLKAVRFVLDE
jgi:predicted esterase